MLQPCSCSLCAYSGRRSPQLGLTNSWNTTCSRVDQLPGSKAPLFCMLTAVMHVALQRWRELPPNVQYSDSRTHASGWARMAYRSL